MALLDVLKSTTAEYERLVHLAGQKFPKPVQVPYGHHWVYRHHPKQRSDLLACHLKCVRMASLLNAALLLHQSGFSQEVYMLCRCMDEAAEDITFFAVNLDDEGINNRQAAHLKEFYQEEYSIPSDPDSVTARHRQPRDKIRAAIARLTPNASTGQALSKAIKAIYSLYSGFTHGPYVFIMELYNGFTGQYHTAGMLNTPRYHECEEQLVNYVYRAIMSLETIAIRMKDEVLRRACNQLATRFAAATGCTGP